MARKSLTADEAMQEVRSYAQAAKRKRVNAALQRIATEFTGSTEPFVESMSGISKAAETVDATFQEMSKAMHSWETTYPGVKLTFSTFNDPESHSD